MNRCSDGRQELPHERRFCRQLDWVDVDPELVRDCVIHFVQARHAGAKWAETDAVPEAALAAYEQELKFRWRLKASQQANRSYSSPVVQGQELLTQTLSEETSLQGQQLPKAFTCGSFHTLADFNSESAPEIGWHPDFKKRSHPDTES